MTAGVDAAEQFGPYLVYERLGIGGMATVHRALERGIESFERIVALKRLLPHLAEDASFIKAFVREAKLASALNHVNIVQIFELGRVGTEYFISMEHIDGRDVRRILRHARKVTGPPPIDVTVGILLQLCDALDYAHTKLDEDGLPMKLVHRDVSPSNVLVTSTGCVKVIDFGIAKAQSSQLRTQTGRVKGKLAYMAPEAVSGGRDLDARCDLFAIGVIAHELLTARPLFASKNEYQTLLKVQRGDIMPPSTYNQHVGGELDAIVLRTLARDPDERYPSAADLRDDLLALRKDHKLQTGQRDIATWLDWAFSLDIPIDAFPPDLQVDVAWDGGEGGSGGPVVLDDVPDVSDKHLRSPTSVPIPQQRLIDDDLDDIPTPAPGDPRRSSSKLIQIEYGVPERRSSELSMALRAANDAAATLDNMSPVRPSGDKLGSPDVMGAADELVAVVEKSSPAAVQQRPVFVSLSADTQPALLAAPPDPDDHEVDDGDDDATSLHAPAPDDGLTDDRDEHATLQAPLVGASRIAAIPSLASAASSSSHTAIGIAKTPSLASSAVAKKIPLLAIPSPEKTAPSMPRAVDDDADTGDTTADDDLDDAERSTDMKAPISHPPRPTTKEIPRTDRDSRPSTQELVPSRSSRPSTKELPSRPSTNDLAPTGDRYMPVADDEPTPLPAPAPAPDHDFDAPEPPTTLAVRSTPDPGSAIKVARTKPGQNPYRASTSANLRELDSGPDAEASVARHSIRIDDIATKAPRGKRRSANTSTIGQALLEREKSGPRPIIVIIALITIAILATAITLAFTR